jgi:hypothetical protein
MAHVQRYFRPSIQTNGRIIGFEVLTDVSGENVASIFKIEARN